MSQAQDPMVLIGELIKVFESSKMCQKYKNCLDPQIKVTV